MVETPVDAGDSAGSQNERAPVEGDTCISAAMNLVARGMRATFADWPRRACVESTIALVAALCPDVDVVPVWGRVAFFGDWEPHAWAELADGTILDMTAGQFFRGGEPWRITRPGDPDHACYEAECRGEVVIRGAITRMIGVLDAMGADGCEREPEHHFDAAGA